MERGHPALLQRHGAEQGRPADEGEEAGPFPGLRADLEFKRPHVLVQHGDRAVFLLLRQGLGVQGIVLAGPVGAGREHRLPVTCLAHLDLGGLRQVVRVEAIQLDVLLGFSVNARVKVEECERHVGHRDLLLGLSVEERHRGGDLAARVQIDASIQALHSVQTRGKGMVVAGGTRMDVQVDLLGKFVARPLAQGGGSVGDALRSPKLGTLLGQVVVLDWIFCEKHQVGKLLAELGGRQPSDFGEVCSHHPARAVKPLRSPREQGKACACKTERRQRNGR
mmetsp:Transcript_45550/g.136128  ORF Transcript_45550/g.136128 Transcript_45550/m.136128 type:complete len:279 (-) Transcript_45550:205-1041(-)